MRLYAFNLRKPHSKKTFKYLFLIMFVSLLLNSALTSQSIKKEKINSSIKVLTPTHSIKKSFKNINIIGFDVLDENKNRVTSSRFKFYPGNKFYIVLYGKRKRTEGKAPTENKLENCKAILEHRNGGYFWSKKTSYLLGEKEIEENWEEWQIGGIYKIRFTFEVPKFALLGRYKLKLFQEKAQFPRYLRLITFDRIKTTIKSPKIHKSEEVEDYILPLGSCLLNPAIQSNGYIVFPWTGNIEFYIDRDIKNFNKIVITVKGTPAFGVYPLLKVYVDKLEIGSAYVNSEWNEYEFDINVDKKSHLLKVRFDNNAGGQGEDRNMFVNMIKLVK